MPKQNENGKLNGTTLRLKIGLAEMLKGGVIMDVMNVEQARIAEEAGAISVMALERVPAMIRAEGGVARMANPKLIPNLTKVKPCLQQGESSSLTMNSEELANRAVPES